MLERLKVFVTIKAIVIFSSELIPRPQLPPDLANLYPVLRTCGEREAIAKRRPLELLIFCISKDDSIHFVWTESRCQIKVLFNDPLDGRVGIQRLRGNEDSNDRVSCVVILAAYKKGEPQPLALYP
ncbi:hypothetical protein GUK36_41400, partial [Rhizobium leguminosarum]